MSTRGIYRFSDENNSFAVYKHYDNYPQGAASFLLDMLYKAWPLPRYEADDMAAAFVAANKGHGGDIRLLNLSQVDDKFDMWQEYEYEIFQAKNGQLIVRVWDGGYQEGEIYFYGRLKDFCLKEMDEMDHGKIVKAFHGEIDETPDLAAHDSKKAKVDEIVNNALKVLNAAANEIKKLSEAA